MAVQNNVVLSSGTTKVGTELFWTMLPSTSLLVATSGLSEDQVKRGLRDLSDKEFVVMHELGCLLPSHPLVRWTESGLDHFEATAEERSWVGPAGLGNFVRHDFAKLEAVNAIAPFYATSGWVLHKIHFYERHTMFAAAEYRHPDHHAPAYVVVCWASMMETQRELFDRLNFLPNGMRQHSVTPTEIFWPAGIALVGDGEWCVARALCMAQAVLWEWVNPSSIGAWYHGSGRWHVSDASSALNGKPPQGIPPLREPKERLRPSMSTRKLGRQTVGAILARSLCAGRGGHKLVELLTLVAICPCGSLARYQSLMGEKPGGKETKRRLRALEKRGLIEVVKNYWRAKRPRKWPQDIPVTLSERGQGAHRYATTGSGRSAFCYVHGGLPEDLFSRTKLGSLHAIIRDKALLHLLKLSWMVHLCCAPGLTPADLSGLAELARDWKKLRRGVLVYLLTLACILHLNHAPGRTPVDVLSLTAMDNVWTQFREGFVEDQWLYQHEDIVYEIFSQLREKGCPFAPGWQASTTLVDGRIINPDGVILVETPWGRQWCYLEVELSDRTLRAVRPRCQKYGSRNRQDNFPLFVVCRDKRAERSFHLEAASSDSLRRLLTTTLSRLNAGGFFGPGVWFHFGRPERVGP